MLRWYSIVNRKIKCYTISIEIVKQVIYINLVRRSIEIEKVTSSITISEICAEYGNGILLMIVIENDVSDRVKVVSRSKLGAVESCN